MGSRSDAKTTALIVAAFVLFGTASFLTYSSLDRTLNDGVQLQTQLALQTRLQSALTHSIDVETGQRGYVISGQAEFLEPYETAQTEIARDLAAFDTFVTEGLLEAADVASLRALIDLRLDEARRLVALRRTEGFAKAAEAIATKKGKLLQDRIRALIDRLQTQTQWRIRATQDDSDASARTARFAIPALLLLACAAFLAGFVLLMRLVKALRRTQAALVVTPQEALDLAHVKSAFLSNDGRLVPAHSAEVAAAGPALDNCDPRVLDALARDSAPQVVLAFVALIVEDAGPALTELLRLAQAEEAGGCAAIAHRFKSSFGSAGATGLAKALSDLEDLARTGSPERGDLTQRAQAILTALPRVKEQLSAWTFFERDAS